MPALSDSSIRNAQVHWERSTMAAYDRQLDEDYDLDCREENIGIRLLEEAQALMDQLPRKAQLAIESVLQEAAREMAIQEAAEAKERAADVGDYYRRAA